MNMLYLSSIVAILTITFLFNEFRASKAEPQGQERYINFDGCKCNNLQCECCSGLDFPNTSHHQVCLIVEIIPNEVTLKETIRVDGTNIHTGQLDPSIAPLCLPPLPTVCFSINHVDIQKRQICTKLTFLFFTLIKFPCIGQQDGQLVVQMNMHV